VSASRFRSAWAAAYVVTAVFDIAVAITSHYLWLSLINWAAAVVLAWWFIDEVRQIVRDDRVKTSTTIRLETQGKQIAEAIRRHVAEGGKR
jgi:hypothetical protein